MWAEIVYRIKDSPQFDYNIDNIAKIFLMSEFFNSKEIFFNSEEIFFKSKEFFNN